MNKDDLPQKAIQVELTVSAWQSAIAQLAALAEISEAQITDAASKGAVWRKKHGMHKLRRLRTLDSEVTPGDKLFLNFDAEVLAQRPMTPELISDQRNYSIWNKPAGMLSQGSKWSDHCTITETVKHLHGKPAFLVHRLDKAASGLIVLAHTKNALRKLAALFAAREVEKHYAVKVHGQAMQDVPFNITEPVENKAAITAIVSATYNTDSDTSDLLVKILTGRKHQIRNHLHGINLPVVGDRLFDKERIHTENLQLRACKLSFQCPFTNENQQFEIKHLDIKPIEKKR